MLTFRGLDNWVDPCHFDKGDNFCHFLSAFMLLQQTPSAKQSILKGKNLLPLGANSFLLELTPLQKRHTHFDRLVSLESIFIPLKYLDTRSPYHICPKILISPLNLESNIHWTSIYGTGIVFIGIMCFLGWVFIILYDEILNAHISIISPNI